MKLPFGWCLDGLHEQCRVSYDSNYSGEMQTYDCPCECHREGASDDGDTRNDQ